MNLSERIRTKHPGPAPELTKLLGGNWTVLTDDVTGVPSLAVAAQLTEDIAGRKVVTGLVVLGDAITATLLHRISVANIENAINLAEQWTNDHRLGVADVLAEIVPLGPLLREGLDSAEFSARVAAHYQVWARRTAHPVAGMAKMADVNPATVAGWVREARLRGLLPPATGRSKAAKR
jgi:hypothetical protein